MNLSGLCVQEEPCSNVNQALASSNQTVRAGESGAGASVL